MAVDISTLNFYSGLNYMKRSEFTGSTEVTLPAADATVSYTVTHNLGYVPFIIAGATLSDTSIIWSNNRVNYLTETSLSGPSNQEIKFYYWATTTTLVMSIRNGTGTGALSGTRTLYWAIYEDYAT